MSWRATQKITPAMLKAFADVKRGSLVRTRHAFVSIDGARHHSQVIGALEERLLVATRTNGRRHIEAVLTPLGAALDIDAGVA